MPLLTEAPTVPDTAHLVGFKASVLMLWADDFGPDYWAHHHFLTREEARAWVAERRQDGEHEFPRPARISPVYAAEEPAPKAPRPKERDLERTEFEDPNPYAIGSARAEAWEDFRIS